MPRSGISGKQKAKSNSLTMQAGVSEPFGKHWRVVDNDHNGSEIDGCDAAGDVPGVSCQEADLADNSNHDMPRFAGETQDQAVSRLPHKVVIANLELVRNAAVFPFISDGYPITYQGQEHVSRNHPRPESAHARACKVVMTP